MPDGVLRQCHDHTHICERMEGIEKAVTEMHTALLGTLEAEGFIRKTDYRIERVEARQALLMRLGTWAAGIFGAGFAVVIGEFVIDFFRH